MYLEEVAPKKGRALQTGIPLFVGFAELDRSNDYEGDSAAAATALRLNSWKQFEQTIKIKSDRGFLDYAVRGFFENGGRNCVVVPLPERQLPYARVKALTDIFMNRGPLEDIDDVDLVCVPDIPWELLEKDPDAIAGVQRHILEHCMTMQNRFAILDAPPVSDTAEAGTYKPATENSIFRVKHWPQRFPNRGRPVEGAMYFPWVLVSPLARHRSQALRRAVPPCGHVAGICARTDAEFGVHKAPANEVVEGILDVTLQIAGDTQSEFNQNGLNCIRSFPGRGLRLWGARTLSTLPSWRYVNVRRLLLTLVRWCDHAMFDIVFEPNGPPLWDRVRDRLGSHCYDLYQQGALLGLTPAEAFFVKCDAETNPMKVREEGRVVCDVGLAPTVPAEFIILRISRSTAGTTASFITTTNQQ